MLSRLALLSFILSSVVAFQPTVRLAAPKISSTARSILLSNEESTQILQSADECAAGECSIDEVASLVADLKEQEKLLSQRLENVMNAVAHLQHLNEKEERKTDEVRSFVQDMLRVFDTSQPMAFPTGFAGDVGKGPTTAYDALPPKKWKASLRKTGSGHVSSMHSIHSLQNHIQSHINA